MSNIQSFSFQAYQVNIRYTDGTKDEPSLFDTKEEMLAYLADLVIEKEMRIEILLGDVKVSYKE